nr:hypothetical protein [Haloferula rosea]
MIAKTEEIGIPGRAVSLFVQKAEQLGPFEDKAIRVVTLSQARKKATEGKLLQQGGIMNAPSPPFVLESVLE